MLSRLAIAAVLLLVTVPALAACGSDDEGDEETGAADVPAAPTSEEPGEADPGLARRVRELIPIARQSLGKSMKEGIRIADAQGELLTIAAEDPAAIRPLLSALEKPDYDLIIDMHSFFIQLGKPGSEKVIGEALLRLEPGPTNDPVVFAYLGSGNAKLVRAAERWAEKNGYEIRGTPTPIAGGWGSAGVYGPPGVPGEIPVAPPP